MAATQASTTSAAAKPLLSFSITPPRKNGPSDAEKKVEELTKQLEEELEKREEAEYFGKTETYSTFSINFMNKFGSKININGTKVFLSIGNVSLVF
jgi:hypothetical protein